MLAPSSSPTTAPGSIVRMSFRSRCPSGAENDDDTRQKRCADRERDDGFRLVNQEQWWNADEREPKASHPEDDPRYPDDHHRRQQRRIHVAYAPEAIPPNRPRHGT